MRCLACNVILSENEATRKYASSGKFLDLCDHCLDYVAEDIPVIDGRGKEKDQAEEYD